MATPPPTRRRSLRLPLVLLLLALVVFSSAVVVATSPIRPLSWRPDPAPPLTGEFRPNGALAALDRLAAGGEGPEDVAVLPDGSLVTGLLDGTLMRGTAESGLDRWADAGGRPLGMDVAPDGTLVVAVAERGIVRFDDEGTATVLVDEIGGAALRFPDDVDVAPDGTVYFSVASDRFGFAEWESDIIESRGNGALYAIEDDGSIRALVRNLYFGNGVAVAPDESFVLVSETSRYRIRRVWLSGPNAPGSDILIANLPGFPDGIAAADDGTYWVALAAPRDRILDLLAPYAITRHFAAGMPDRLRPSPKPSAHVIHIDSDGQVLGNLDDRSDSAFAMVTSVQPAGEFLYLGSLVETSIGRFRLPTE